MCVWTGSQHFDTLFVHSCLHAHWYTAYSVCSCGLWLPTSIAIYLFHLMLLLQTRLLTKRNFTNSVSRTLLILPFSLASGPTHNFRSHAARFCSEIQRERCFHFPKIQLRFSMPDKIMKKGIDCIPEGADRGSNERYHPDSSCFFLFFLGSNTDEIRGW